MFWITRKNIYGRKQGKVVGNYYFHGSSETGREATWSRHDQKHVAEQEGNFHFQTSITPLFKTNLPLGALEHAPGTSEVVSGGQGRENQYTPGMPQQAVGEGSCVSARAGRSKPSCDDHRATPLGLLPLLSPRDMGYDQRGKSLIIYFTCLEHGEES